MEDIRIWWNLRIWCLQRNQEEERYDFISLGMRSVGSGRLRVAASTVWVGNASCRRTTQNTWAAAPLSTHTYVILDRILGPRVWSIIDLCLHGWSSTRRLRSHWLTHTIHVEKGKKWKLGAYNTKRLAHYALLIRFDVHKKTRRLSYKRSRLYRLYTAVWRH